MNPFDFGRSFEPEFDNIQIRALPHLQTLLEDSKGSRRNSNSY
jgi:hypothetical protein